MRVNTRCHIPCLLCPLPLTHVAASWILEPLLGEDLVGSCPSLQWLLLARTLLLEALKDNPHQQAVMRNPDAAAEDSGVDSGSSPSFAITSAARLGRLAALLAAHPPVADAGGLIRCDRVSWWLWSWPWWSLRCAVSQQHVLDGRSQSLMYEASQVGRG